MSVIFGAAVALLCRWRCNMNPMACTTEIALANVYAITSHDSVARNANLTAACEREQLKCTRIPGVDKRLLDIEALQREAEQTQVLLPEHKPLPRFNLSIGEYAVSLAHRNVLDIVLMNDIACAMVLENDATFAPSFKQRMQASSIPWDSIDVLKLGSCASSANTMPQAAHRERAPIVVGAGSGGWCATGYIVTRRGALVLREAQSPVWTVADGVFRLWDNSIRSDVRMRNGSALPILRVNHTLPSVVTQHRMLRHSSELGFHSADRVAYSSHPSGSLS